MNRRDDTGKEEVWLNRTKLFDTEKKKNNVYEDRCRRINGKTRISREEY